MIFHINRMAFKSGLSEEQRRACLDAVRQAGAANPAVKSYVVGPELGGEFEYGAVYVVEDLDGYWAYLEYPPHVREELWGIPHLEKFAAIDVSDSDDPQLGEKIAALQARHLQDGPAGVPEPGDVQEEPPAGLLQGQLEPGPAVEVVIGEQVNVVTPHGQASG